MWWLTNLCRGSSPVENIDYMYYCTDTTAYASSLNLPRMYACTTVRMYACMHVCSVLLCISLCLWISYLSISPKLKSELRCAKFPILQIPVFSKSKFLYSPNPNSFILQTPLSSKLLYPPNSFMLQTPLSSKLLLLQVHAGPVGSHVPDQIDNSLWCTVKM